MVWILVCEFWWVKFMWIMLWVYVNSGVWVYVNSGDTNLCEFMWILVCEFWWYKFMWICAKNDMSCFSKLQKMTCSVSPIKIQKMVTAARIKNRTWDLRQQGEMKHHWAMNFVVWKCTKLNYLYEEIEVRLYSYKYKFVCRNLYHLSIYPLQTHFMHRCPFLDYLLFYVG
jgi:hypothetical protein